MMKNLYKNWLIPFVLAGAFFPCIPVTFTSNTPSEESSTNYSFSLTTAFAETAVTPSTPPTENELADAETARKKNPSWYERLGEFIVDGIYIVIYRILLQVGYFVFYIGASAFDLLLDFGVISFGLSLEKYNILPVINMVWGVTRDVANIILLGMWIFIAIATIINNKQYNIKTFAVRIIIVALLINFSLFFTKAFIDLNNFFAFQFYRGIAPAAATGAATNQGISTKIGSAIKITSSEDIVKYLEEGKKKGVSQFLADVIGKTIFMIGAGLVLLFGAYHIAIRTVGLFFVLIGSAIATVFYLVPNLNKYFIQWRDSLIQFSIFGPILIFLLWAVVKITEAMVGQNNLSATSSASETGFVLLNYIIILGLLLGAVMISSMMSLKATSALTGMSAPTSGLGWIRNSLAGAAAGRIAGIQQNRGMAALEAAQAKLTNATSASDRAAAREDLKKIEKKLGSGKTGFVSGLTNKALVKAGAKDTSKDLLKNINKAITEKKTKALESGDDVRIVRESREAAAKQAAELAAQKAATAAYTGNKKERDDILKKEGNEDVAKAVRAGEEELQSAKQALDTARQAKLEGKGDSGAIETAIQEATNRIRTARQNIIDSSVAAGDTESMKQLDELNQKIFAYDDNMDKQQHADQVRKHHESVLNTVLKARGLGSLVNAPTGSSDAQLYQKIYDRATKDSKEIAKDDEKEQISKARKAQIKLGERNNDTPATAKTTQMAPAQQAAPAAGGNDGHKPAPKH
jgi:hypothetical protein